MIEAFCKEMLTFNYIECDYKRMKSKDCTDFYSRDCKHQHNSSCIRGTNTPRHDVIGKIIRIGWLTVTLFSGEMHHTTASLIISP